MTEKEPTPEDLESAETDVEGHSVDEEDDGEAGVLDVNFGCA